MVGVVDAEGRRIVAHGARDRGDDPPLDGDTVFEIGSITKVFTALLLAEPVRRGEVALDDPVAKYLPPGVTVPERGGKQITLVDLATHTSGLPRWPDDIAPGDLSPKDSRIPTPTTASTSCTASWAPTARAATSAPPTPIPTSASACWAMPGAARRRVDYEALVESGSPAAGHGQHRHRAVAGRRRGSPSATGMSGGPSRGLGSADLAGAGALRSTANDMLTFLAAELGFVDTPLKRRWRRRPNRAGPAGRLSSSRSAGASRRRQWARSSGTAAPRRLSLFRPVRPPAPGRAW